MKLQDELRHYAVGEGGGRMNEAMREAAGRLDAVEAAKGAVEQRIERYRLEPDDHDAQRFADGAEFALELLRAALAASPKEKT